MIEDIRKFIAYIRFEKQGREYRNRIILIVCLITLLLIMNRYFIIKYSDQEYFMIHRTLARLLIHENIDPYRSDISEVLKESISAESLIFNNSHYLFQLPIQHLFIFYPFSLIGDYLWSLSLWLTINQLLVAVSVNRLIKILNWRIGISTRIIIAGLTFLSYMAWSSFLNTGTSLIQLNLVLSSFHYLKTNKPLQSGIILGIAMFDPFHFLVLFGMLVTLITYHKQFSIITWLIITNVLLYILGIIFNENWFSQMIKNILIEKSFFPLISYSSAIDNAWFSIRESSIVNILPILLIIWILIEWFRTPKDSLQPIFWLVSLTIIANLFITMRSEIYSVVLFIPVYLFIAYLWLTRSQGVIAIIVITIMGICAILLPFLNEFTHLLDLPIYSVHLINAILILLMLYWVRWWVLNTYQDNSFSVVK